MESLGNGYVQLDEGEMPQLRNNRVGKNIEDVIEKQAAFLVTTKRGKNSQQYVAKLEPVDLENRVFKVVAADPVSSYAKKSMAGTFPGNTKDSNAYNRFAAAILQEGLMEEQGKPVDRTAAAISYGRNSALGYETHHINEIDTEMQILASLNREAQEEYIKKLIKRGYRLSDDPRNQVRAYGSAKNIPGYKGPSGEKMVPDNYPGFSEHKAVHDDIRTLAKKMGLPDARLSTGDNTIAARMAGLPTESQKVSLGMALTELGRLSVMRKLAKPGSERFPERINAERKQRGRVYNEMADAFFPLTPEMEKLGPFNI